MDKSMKASQLPVTKSGWRNISIALKMVGATSIENFNPSGTKPPE